MGYSRMSRPRQQGPSGGFSGRFRPGMGNPSFGGGAGVRRPTGRVSAGGGGGGGGYGGGIATIDSYAGKPAPNTGPWDAFKRSRGTRTYSGHGPIGSLNRGGSGFVWNRNRAGTAGFNEPDIPDERIWEGEKWSPSQSYESNVTDTSELIAATDALINEQLGTTMAEAGRKFGQLGGLMSGGGIGSGYAGTLAESERGSMRDRAEMRHRYRFQAEQADAERQARALEGAMNRELGAHEGYEGRRFGAHGMGADYDKWKYGAEVGAASREQQNAIAEMMSLYGM